ncbi:hypothetical protein TVAG_075750 [Trichomonas vaginalis G3]|uniref:Uncharacterized protein n=1 Tax=Trichomonas vaginalis (strain ATCC PRA-98 / G3) TaxID=412133 RepID=A2D9H2_TRIV3|nr:hypothetical protein TVAG_075750 [Trichomonas vaginalis G3]|eukprot:XP_001583814.1 hypothetical protein [Trichomonas vaginalis G3]
MTCELSFTLKDGNKVNLSELRKRVEANSEYDLLGELKDSKMKVVWPHTRPEPTGDVRAKLIHARMHKNVENHIRTKDISSKEMLSSVSSIFVLLVTVPLIAFGLYTALKWLGFTPESAFCWSFIGSLIFFFAELALTILELFKRDMMQKGQLQLFNAKTNTQPVEEHKTK